MQSFLDAPNAGRSRLRRRPGFTALALLVLSLGVGATTAVFTLVDDVMPPAGPSVRCETVMRISDIPTSFTVGDAAGRAELRDRVSDAYYTGIESAGQAIGSLPDAAQELGERPLLALLGAGVLGFLAACARAASGLISRARTPLVSLGAAVGGLAFATVALRTLHLPAVGMRAAAFALCISLVAVWFARFAQRKGAPLTA